METSDSPPAQEASVIDDRPSQEDRTYAMLAHLSSLSGSIIPLGNLIAPVVLWQVFKDKWPFASESARECLNFQITITLIIVGSLPLCLVFIGIPIFFAAVIFDLVVTILAAIKANEGVHYRYPMTLRLVK